MKVKLLILTFLISVVAATAQNSILNLVKSENLFSEIMEARIDSKNSIVEIETGDGTYYFDLRSGRLLTKFGRSDWADFGTKMICDSLLKRNPLKYSNDSLMAIDSLGQLFKHKIALNFTPINRGILPIHEIWYYYENGQEPNEIEITNNECGYKGSYIVCEEGNPLHKLIKNFWIKINNTVDVSDNSYSTNHFTISKEDKCSFIIKSDSALIFDYEIFENKEVFENDFNVNSYEIILKSQANYADEFEVYSMRKSIKTNNLLQYSSENNKYFFDESFFLISPDSTKLLYAAKNYLRGYQPIILFDLQNNSVVSVFTGESCMQVGFKLNETVFSENVISFSHDSKFVLIGNRLFNTNDGSEVFEYYKWLGMNDKYLGLQPWDDESEFEYINWGAHFSFFTDSTNICVVSGEKLNYFNLNNMTGTNWQKPEEFHYRQDSLLLKLNNIDISECLEFPRQGDLDRLNSSKVEFTLSNDSNRIEWYHGLISIDVLDTYFTRLDSNYFSEIFKSADLDLKKQLLTPEGLKSYMRDLRNSQINDISIYSFGEFFISINRLTVIFWNSTCTKKLLCIPLYQDWGSMWEAQVNRVDFDISGSNFIFSTGFEVYVVPISLIEKYNFKVPQMLSQHNQRSAAHEPFWSDDKEILAYGIMYFPFEEVNTNYPYNPIWIECENDGEILRQNELDVVGIECSRKGNVLISFSDNSSCLFDSSFKFISRIKSIDIGWPMSAGFIDDYNLIYYPSGNSIRFFDISGKYLFDLFDDKEFFLSNGYYSFSKEFIRRNHFVTNDLKVIGFDQLDPIYNRPDIVLDSIGKYFGGADKDLVANYRAAWEKRIERLGLDKGKLSTGEIAVPNADIVNADQIEYEDKDGSVIIQVKANDPKYTLRRYNVLVNEVPVYGSDGISISELNTKQWERTDTIALSIGNNKIQVSVMNELGLENFKYPTYVNYTPEKKIESKTYYVGIGVNEFNDASRKLNYCVKDVQDLAQAFAKNQSKVDTLVFTNSEVTKENILALKSYLQKNTTINDKVIISCSSHGLLDDSLNFYLATYDVDFAHPEKRGLAYEDLEGLLDGIPARQKLLLLDACNSGENERMFLQNKSSDQMAQAGMKGVDVEIVNDEINTFHQMTELFVNVRNNTGSVIIAASGGMQSAQEGRVVNGMKIENGAFTYSVLEYLAKEFNDQEKCTVNGMKNYVERRVEEITNAEQKPTSRQETMEVDWFFRQ